jgi:hypothetical protein
MIQKTIEVADIELVERPDDITDSRFVTDDVLITDEQIYLKAYRRFIIEEDETDDEYVLSAGDRGRLDLVAEKFYKNKNLWWVLAEFNKLKDPFDFELGKVIRIPKLARIFRDVL